MAKTIYHVKHTHEELDELKDLARIMLSETNLINIIFYK